MEAPKAKLLLWRVECVADNSGDHDLRCIKEEHALLESLQVNISINYMQKLRLELKLQLEFKVECDLDETFF